VAFDTDASKMSEEEILRKLDDAAFIQRFEKSEDWKFFREACEHLARQAEREMDHTDPIKNPTAIIECQVTKKFCKNVVGSIVNGIKSMGKLAFEEAKDRGIKEVIPEA
jgi:hypothetical protein